MLIAFPVLPLLASTMVSPGRSSPSRSARSIMYLAIRALIDPDGLRNSSLTQTPVNHDQRRIADRVQDRPAAFRELASGKHPLLPMHRGEGPARGIHACTLLVLRTMTGLQLRPAFRKGQWQIRPDRNGRLRQAVPE